MSNSLDSLNELIDNVFDELSGRGDVRQLMRESQSRPRLETRSYGLLASPESPTITTLRTMIREVVDTQTQHDEMNQSITQMIDALHMRGDIANEFKNKTNELIRRLRCNGFGGYDYYEIATDKQRAIMTLGMVPEGFEEMMGNIKAYVDGLAFIYRFGTNAERDEAEFTSPITWKRIQELYPEWWDRDYDVVDTRSIRHPMEKKPETLTLYPTSYPSPEFEEAENEIIRQINRDLN